MISLRSLLLLALLSVGCRAAAQPRVIAHRGYWMAPGAAQNSLASFVKADSIGCYGAEFDVWMTADDKLVVNHDRIYPGTEIHMERARCRDIVRNELPNGERLPTLDAYLATAAAHPAIRLVLELKCHATPERESRAAGKIVRALKRYGLAERTDLISFSFHACCALRKLLPEANILYLTGDRTPQQIADAGLSGIDYHTQVLDEHPEWIEEAHALGLEVNVWTVNDEKQMRRFIAQGVDYITTDCPEVLQRLLREAE